MIPIRALQGRLSPEPSSPPDGQVKLWLSDGVGVGVGDIGDLMCKITIGAYTRVETIIDFFVNELSLVFNGIDEYVGFGNVHGFNWTDTFSISFWAKTTTTSNGGTICGKQLAAGILRGYRIVMRGSDTDQIRISFQHNDSSQAITCSYDVGTLNDGDWHHCVFTNDGTGSSGMNFYIDSVLSDRTIWEDTLVDTIVEPTAGFAFGARYTIGVGAQNFWSGQLDQVTVWNIELTQTNITDLFNSGVPCDPRVPGISGLVSYYRCGDDDTDQISDFYGSYHGTLINMTIEDNAVEDVP